MALTVFGIIGAVAADTGLSVELERENVSLGNPVYLYLEFTGSHTVTRPDIAEPDGINIRYVGPSTRVSVVNGRVSQSITHTFMLHPRKEGEYTIGPFTVRHNSRSYTAESVVLNVTARPARPADPRTATRQPPAVAPGDSDRQMQPYLSEDIFLQLELPKRVLYVNEAITATIKLYVRDMQLEDIEYPVLPHEGFSSGPMREPDRMREYVRGQRYQVLVFKRELSAMREGKTTLGPARIRCTMLRSQPSSARRSFFGRGIFDDDPFFGRAQQRYPIELESLEVPLEVLTLPVQGRPESFQGAVGQFEMEVGWSEDSVSPGDPLTMRIEIKGRGNLDSVTMPVIGDPDGFRTYDPRIEESGRGKVYEQIFIPRHADAGPLPEVRFSYFDPEREEYVELVEGPFSITIERLPERAPSEETFAMRERERRFFQEPGEDLVHIKKDSGNFYKGLPVPWKGGFFWAGNVLAVLFLLVFRIYRDRRRKLNSDSIFARTMKARKKASQKLTEAERFLKDRQTHQALNMVYEALTEYLTVRLGLPPGVINKEELCEHLEASGCSNEITGDLMRVLSFTETVRYASSLAEKEQIEDALTVARRTIALLEKRRRR